MNQEIRRDEMPKNKKPEVVVGDAELAEDQPKMRELRVYNTDVPLDQGPPPEFRIYLTGEIKPDQATHIVEKLYEANEINSQYDFQIPIRMIINSPGGDLASSQMICDVMDEIPSTVVTMAYGQAMSGGIMILMNGTPGFRYCSYPTQLMSHRFITAMEGSHSDFHYRQEELDRMHGRLVDHYKKCTGLTTDKIEATLLNEHDVWLTAEQCKELGVIDHIIKGGKLYEPKKRNKSRK